MNGCSCPIKRRAVLKEPGIESQPGHARLLRNAPKPPRLNRKKKKPNQQEILLFILSNYNPCCKHRSVLLLWWGASFSKPVPLYTGCSHIQLKKHIRTSVTCSQYACKTATGLTKSFQQLNYNYYSVGEFCRIL